MSRPDTFIVGAPRCGTTWLFEQLSRHPEVAASRLKEPTYFGSDLQAMRSALPGRSPDNLEDYLACFPSGPAGRTVEASAVYLFSRDAVARIAEFDSTARLIVMVRDPVEQIHSLHAIRARNAAELDRDLGDALDHEVDRRGEPSPLLGLVRGYPYRGIAAYADQLERVFESFSRQAVHIVVHDDLRADATRVYDDVVRFLDLPPGPSADRRAVNAKSTARSIGFARMLRFPSARASRLTRTLLPNARLRTVLRARLTAMNRSHHPPPPLDPVRRRVLADELRPGVERLAEMLGRDLSHWMPAEVDNG